MISLGCNHYPSKYRLKYYGEYLKKTSNNPIKTEGFYYFKNTDNNWARIIILYDDGVIYQSGYSCEYFEYLKMDYPSFEINNNQKKCIWNWGYYSIEKDTLKIQTFSSGKFGLRRAIQENLAVIVDDTTLHFFQNNDYMETIFGVQTEERPLDYLMYFKECKIKPDSMNWMMDDFIEKDE